MTVGALKPRGVLGPIEAEREARCVVIRIPLEHLGESIVLQLDNDEARELGTVLHEATA